MHGTCHIWISSAIIELLSLDDTSPAAFMKKLEVVSPLRILPNLIKKAGFEKNSGYN